VPAPLSSLFPSSLPSYPSCHHSRQRDNGRRRPAAERCQKRHAWCLRLAPSILLEHHSRPAAGCATQLLARCQCVASRLQRVRNALGTSTAPPCARRGQQLRAAHGRPSAPGPGRARERAPLYRAFAGPVVIEFEAERCSLDSLEMWDGSDSLGKLARALLIQITAGIQTEYSSLNMSLLQMLTSVKSLHTVIGQLRTECSANGSPMQD
jgi:hypothetical protein